MEVEILSHGKKTHPPREYPGRSLIMHQTHSAKTGLKKKGWTSSRKRVLLKALMPEERGRGISTANRRLFGGKVSGGKLKAHPSEPNRQKALAIDGGADGSRGWEWRWFQSSQQVTVYFRGPRYSLNPDLGKATGGKNSGKIWVHFDRFLR